MDIASILIQLVSGVVGGNAQGAASKATSLGPVGNSITGGIGGVIVGQLLPMVMNSGALAHTGLDVTAIATGFAEGGVGGAVTAAVIGFVKSKMTKA